MLLALQTILEGPSNSNPVPHVNVATLPSKFAFVLETFAPACANRATKPRPEHVAVAKTRPARVEREMRNDRIEHDDNTKRVSMLMQVDACENQEKEFLKRKWHWKVKMYKRFVCMGALAAGVGKYFARARVCYISF